MNIANIISQRSKHPFYNDPFILANKLQPTICNNSTQLNIISNNLNDNKVTNEIKPKTKETKDINKINISV